MLGTNIRNLGEMPFFSMAIRYIGIIKISGYGGLLQGWQQFPEMAKIRYVLFLFADFTWLNKSNPPRNARQLQEELT